MYLNIAKNIVQRTIFTFVVIFTSMALLVFGILSGVVFDSNESTTEMLVTAYFLIVLVLIDYVFIKAIVRTMRASKIARLLARDTDGLVEVDKIAKEMHMSPGKFTGVFMDCVSRALLVKCTLYAEDPTMILLENGKKDIREKYAVLHCENCGAPNAVRIGFDVKCKYCDTMLVQK